MQPMDRDYFRHRATMIDILVDDGYPLDDAVSFMKEAERAAAGAEPLLGADFFGDCRRWVHRVHPLRQPSR